MSNIDDIKGSLDVVDVISEHVKLQRAGRNYKANCPFHSEKTPSFIVDPSRQSWRCFGACSTGGDIFSFVMRLDGVEFKEALSILANKAGVILQHDIPMSNKKIPAEINHMTCEFYKEALLGVDGDIARRYLKSRGIDQKTAESFDLGYSPRSGDSLKSHLLFHDIDIDQAIEAGVLVRTQSGSVRDFFWDRIMFPIHDMNGRVVGFGARGLGGAMPKYINTSATGMFDKKKTLYGLHLARDSIRTSGEGVVVEGYMDVIAAHQHGFDNVVASMGTALTPEQVVSLKRFGRSFVLALDQDQAGQEATLRSLDGAWKIFDQSNFGRRNRDPFAREIIDIKVLSLPDGKDPDEFIRSKEGDWERVVSDSVPVMDYLIPAVSARFDLDSPGGKGKVIEVLAPIFGSMDPFDYDKYTNQIAVAINANLGSVKKSIQTNLRKPRFYDRSNNDLYPQETNDELHVDTPDVLVDHLFVQMFAWPEFLNVEALDSVNPDIFHKTEDKHLFINWRKFISRGIEGDVQARFESTLDDYLKNRYMDIRNKPFIKGEKENIKLDFKYCMGRLEERYLKSYRSGMFYSEVVSQEDFEVKLAEIDKKIRDKKKDLMI